MIGPWTEVTVTCWYHADRKQITGWSGFSSSWQLKKQEVRLISKSDHGQRTVQSISKEDLVRKQSCTPHASLVPCVWLWNMIHDQRKAYCVVSCAQHPKWAYCLTICRKRHTLQIPRRDRNLSHFPQNVFSSKKKAWWKQRSAFWAFSWAATLLFGIKNDTQIISGLI